jgi:hypothetical protein
MAPKNFRSKKSDVVFVFRVWCNSVDQCYNAGHESGQKSFRFDALSAELYRHLADDLPPLVDADDGSCDDQLMVTKLAANDRFENDEKPNLQIIARIEKELGFNISGLDDLVSMI